VRDFDNVEEVLKECLKMEQRLNELRAELGRSSSIDASSNTAPSVAAFPITAHSNAAHHITEAGTPSFGNSGAQQYGCQDGQRAVMRTGTRFSGIEATVISRAPGRPKWMHRRQSVRFLHPSFLLTRSFWICFSFSFTATVVKW